MAAPNPHLSDYAAGRPDDPAVVEQDLPPRWSRLTGWLVLSLFGALGLASVLVRFPETVGSRFLLVPEMGADPLQAPLAGVLQQVAVAEGQEVAEGEELFAIRSPEVLTWRTELETAREDERFGREQATRAEETHQALLKIKAAELEQIAQERAYRENHLKTVMDLCLRTELLRQEQLVSEVELLRARLEEVGARKDLQLTEQAGEKIRLEVQRMETERRLQRSEELANREKLRVRIESLSRRLESTTGLVAVVRAPCRGVVLSISQRNSGSVVQAGQELCQLARVEGRPVVQLTLAQAGLDRVAAGQTARLYFDAFPYQRYGTLAGRVDWVSPSGVVQGEERWFRARVLPEALTFSSADGPMAIRVGMTGEARIRVGSRTLAEYAFEPLRALRERVR